MNTKTAVRSILLLVFLLASLLAADAKSLWPATARGRPRVWSLVADPIAHQVGDVLSILISETTKAGVEAATESEQEVGGGMDPGQGLLSFIPFFSLGAKDKYDAKGSHSWRGSFVTRMTATVMEITPEGLLKIEGTRSVYVNGEKQELVLSGLVRPYDISPQNTIVSEQIANARIEYKGAGPIARKVKPGILTRLFDWLF